MMAFFMPRKTVDLLKDPPRKLITIDNNCAHDTNRLLIVLSIHHHFDSSNIEIVIMNQLQYGRAYLIESGRSILNAIYFKRTEFINEPNEIVRMLLFSFIMFLFALGFAYTSLTVFLFNPKIKIHHEYKL